MATCRISDTTKHRIIYLREEGVSVTDISNELGISRNTVYRWLERWKNDGALQNHVSFGRPRQTSTDQDRNIVEQAISNRFINTRSMSVEFGTSQSTIRRRLREHGLRHRIPAKKPILTPRHKAQRLQFARNYLNFNFDNVIFVDEKVFCSSAQGRLSLYRTPNTRYDERNVLPNNRSGRISLGFWGWMTQSGPGELVEVGGRMNGPLYKEILENVLLPTARIFFPHERIRFVQDNSSVHNSRVVQNYINGNMDLELISMPPHSPDLNPIENLWGKMVQVWDSTRARNTANLRTHVEEVWESMRGDNFCYNAVQSMRKRLSDVILAEGGYTRY